MILTIDYFEANKEKNIFTCFYNYKNLEANIF